MKPEPIAVRKTIKLAPDVLKPYEGTYALSLVFAITITVEDGKLMAQATGQDKVPDLSRVETKFFYKVVDAQIDFEKGKDGKVEKLILHQNGQDMPGLKLPGAAENRHRYTPCLSLDEHRFALYLSSAAISSRSANHRCAAVS